MEKVYVKLRDKGSLCNDTSQGVCIIGARAFYVDRTLLINRALSSGILVLLKEDEALKHNEEYDLAKAQAVEAEHAEIERKREAKLANAMKNSGLGKKATLEIAEAVEVEAPVVNLEATTAVVGPDAKEEVVVPAGDQVADVNTDAAAVTEEVVAVVDEAAEAVVVEEVVEVVEEVTAPVVEPVTKPDYMAWTNDQLTVELKKRDINLGGATKKAELAALLTMDDEK